MSKLYIVLGIKPPPPPLHRIPDVVAGITYKQPDGPYEDVHFICETKEKVEAIKKSYIEITNIYEIDAKLINIDEY